MIYVLSLSFDIPTKRLIGIASSIAPRNRVGL